MPVLGIMVCDCISSWVCNSLYEFLSRSANLSRLIDDAIHESQQIRMQKHDDLSSHLLPNLS